MFDRILETVFSVCQKMNAGVVKNAFYKIFLQVVYLIYMYKEDLPFK